MTLRRCTLLILANILLVNVSGLAVAKIKTAAKAVEVLNLAFEVFEFLGNINSQDSENQQADREKLLQELNAQIESAKIEILSSIVTRSKTDRIDDAVIAIHSSLVDLKNIADADTPEEKEELINLFMKRYEEHDVIQHTRFLPRLLTYISPGDNVDLITLLREESRCSSLAFNEFRDFYIKLISDGALLDIAYIQSATEHVNISRFQDQWVDTILDAEEIFANEEQICEARFPTDLQADLETYDDPSTLRTQLDQRYQDKNIDLLFYSGLGTHQFHAFQYDSTKKAFFWVRKLDEITKILVVNKVPKSSVWNKQQTKKRLGNCLAGIVVDRDDEDAAKNVLNTVLRCHGLAHPVGTAIVYFENQKFPTRAFNANPDSPVIEVTKDGVTLEYCFKTLVECKWQQLVQNTERAIGRFRIKVYPNLDGGDHTVHLIGGCQRVVLDTWLWVVAFLAVHFLRWQ